MSSIPLSTRSIALVLFVLLSVAKGLASSMKKRVLVSGAGGQTGQALFRKFLALPDEFDPLGLVRTEESKATLVESGVPASNIAVIDVSSSDSGKLLKEATQGCVAFCIGTSAKPSPTGEMNEEGRPIFGFPNGIPEQVDWIGQKNQFDACGPDTHIVVCSTMGGTDPNHPLNNLGRDPDDGSGGNIVKWKRKSEVYLTESGRPYTIVHPGGLLNEAGGERELVVGVDDETEGTDSRTVPRQDVAEVMLQAVRYPEAYKNRSFDLRAMPVEDGAPTTEFETLLASLKGRNCDYALGETM